MRHFLLSLLAGILLSVGGLGCGPSLAEKGINSGYDRPKPAKPAQ